MTIILVISITNETCRTNVDIFQTMWKYVFMTIYVKIYKMIIYALFNSKLRLTNHLHQLIYYVLVKMWIYNQIQVLLINLMCVNNYRLVQYPYFRSILLSCSIFNKIYFIIVFTIITLLYHFVDQALMSQIDIQTVGNCRCFIVYIKLISFRTRFAVYSVSPN